MKIDMDIDIDITQEQINELVRLAQEAYPKAYVPYSDYPVGAATLWESGRIYSGCNVENASFGLTVCAERNAVFQAVAQGERQLQAVAVAVPAETFPSLCGACRQVLREFCADCLIILINGHGEIRFSGLKKLLPDSFGPEFLK